MEGQRKKITAAIVVGTLGLLVIAAIYFQFFSSEPRRYPLESEIYMSNGYASIKELTTKKIFLQAKDQIIFQYLVRDTVTLADTGRFSYNEKTGFLSTSEWKDDYPFTDRRIRIFNDPDPVIRIGKTQYSPVVN